jgi:hypothetical protein
MQNCCAPSGENNLTPPLSDSEWINVIPDRTAEDATRALDAYTGAGCRRTNDGYQSLDRIVVYGSTTLAFFTRLSTSSGGNLLIRK